VGDAAQGRCFGHCHTSTGAQRHEHT